MNEEQRQRLRNQLIVALDVDTEKEALDLVDKLDGLVDRFKVGSRMFTALGPSILTKLAKRDARVFLDLKYHDIPSVVGDAVRIVALHHPAVFLLTVHASGGPAMVAAAAEAVERRVENPLEVVAVTALTSLSPAETRILGIESNLDDWVLKLSELALEAGAHGLVCSPNEVEKVRSMYGPEPTIVTPGVRPTDQDRQPGDDQARTATPAEAIEMGSTYLVMGRPIYQADDPVAVVQAIGETL
jgi:orotidine-5'-phosphate decarboxylase